VFVNRVWKSTFGKGLTSMDDFGSRGTAPTHRKLLDWLAVEFIESGWDVKALFRLIVLSNTYRQSSDQRPELLKHDADNRWLARQNRLRLDAELVRDNALAIGGLLSFGIGGRSVRPFQPEGFWAPRFSEKEYHASTGDDMYRRGIYSYWCRNYLHPAMQVFDAPSRQSCTSDRSQSSTPLQALVLLNDPNFEEASRALAARVVGEGGETFSDKIEFAYQLSQSRSARPAEISLLAELFEKHRREFSADHAALAVAIKPERSQFKPPDGADLVELAAWTSVARVILNLYETVTRK
jgi:hypothetical protein